MCVKIIYKVGTRVLGGFYERNIVSLLIGEFHVANTAVPPFCLFMTASAASPKKLRDII